MLDAFIIARNPEADSSLPFLVHLPVDGGTWLKARADVAVLDILERIAVLSCERRGPVVDLVLDRGTNRRAQFVFTRARGRSMIFWQTAKAAANARPGLRVPQRPARRLDRIAIDTRERYGYSFKGREVAVERIALRAGDYAAFVDGAVIAVVERKAMDDFTKSLVDNARLCDG